MLSLLKLICGVFVHPAQKVRSEISRSRECGGRRPTSKEIRELIFRLVAENPMWGAPRIHGELQMLGFDISERTVLRWMQKAPKDPEPGGDGRHFFATIVD